MNDFEAYWNYKGNDEIVAGIMEFIKLERTSKM